MKGWKMKTILPPKRKRKRRRTKTRRRRYFISLPPAEGHHEGVQQSRDTLHRVEMDTHTHTLLSLKSMFKVLWVCITVMRLDCTFIITGSSFTSELYFLWNTHQFLEFNSLGQQQNTILSSVFVPLEESCEETKEAQSLHASVEGNVFLPFLPSASLCSWSVFIF